MLIDSRVPKHAYTHHKFATATGLTPEELESCSIPEEAVLSLQTDFHYDKKKFSVHHSPNFQKPIMLIGKVGEDVSSFLYVGSRLMREVWGMPNEAIEHINAQFFRDQTRLVLSPSGLDLTQKGVAQLAREYEKRFGQTEISAHYWHIRRSDLRNPGFPVERFDPASIYLY